MYIAVFSLRFFVELGREPWPSGYVQEVVSSNRGSRFWNDFFTNIVPNVCLKRPKINDKRGRGWPI